MDVQPGQKYAQRPQKMGPIRQRRALGQTAVDAQAGADEKTGTNKPGQLWIIWPQESQIRPGFVVILYFMHVKYSSPLVKVVVISGFVWFFIALGLTFTDYLTRPWLPQSAGWQDNPLRAKTALPDPVPGEAASPAGQH
ncbi:MAG: hypothetical protein WBD40_08790 [Tepidisphaeraceae bacterium]